LRAPKLLIWLLAVQIVVGGAFVFAVSQDFFQDGDAAVREDTEAPRRFDERRAFAFLREQVERYGPRPAGSDASRRLAARLRRLLPEGRYERLPRHLDESGRLRNVAGRIRGARPAVVIGAHYDTEAEPEGHVGANDGAAGTAVVVELARVLRRAKRPPGAPELRFVLFDGEEEPAGCANFETCGIRGSRAYVEAHQSEVGGLILLDYVGEKGLRVPREGSSDIELWERLRAAARRTGKARTFPDEVGQTLIDDHTPFLEAGITAIDLIDFEYPQRDTLQDTVDKTSAASLDAVGETVADLVLSLRSGRL
jgi:glutaminyl-peptide cyclotransferase